MVETPAKSADELTVGMLAQRIDGMDEAIRLLQEAANRQPSPREVELQVHALKELKTAHFQALRELIDARFDGNKTALDAAFQAARETGQEQIRSRDQAIAKSEAAIAKQIDALQTLWQTTAKNTDDKFNDLKDRFNTSAGRSKGIGDGLGYVVGAIGLISTVITIATVLFTRTPAV